MLQIGSGNTYTPLVLSSLLGRWSKIPQAGFIAVGFLFREYILGWHVSPLVIHILFCVLGGALLPSCVYFFWVCHYGSPVFQPSRCGYTTHSSFGFQASYSQRSHRGLCKTMSSVQICTRVCAVGKGPYPSYMLPIQRRHGGHRSRWS